MTLRNVPKSYTLEEQRQEINLVAADLDTAVDGVQTFTGEKTFSDNLYLPDGKIIHFGDDNDLKIYFEPSTGGGHIEAPIDLKLQTGRLIVNDAANTAVQLIANQNGSVELYYNAVKKFETSSNGVTILGDTVIGDQNTASSQLKIFSGGTNASPEYFEFAAGGNVATIQLNDNATLGEMQIKARQGIALFGNTSHISVWAKGDGSGSLLYQSAEKLVTTNTGVSITGTASATEFSGALTGNADTATALQTARTIGGVSFDGTANIDLPGVNTAGNQDTSGNAATATALETARTIAGQSFDGTANITIAATDLSDTDQALATTSDVTFNNLTVNGIAGVYGSSTANTSLTVSMDASSTNGLRVDSTVAGTDNGGAINIYNSSGTRTVLMQGNGYTSLTELSFNNVSGSIGGSGGTENWIGLKHGSTFGLALKTAGLFPGYVGINTTTPDYRLDVNHPTDAGFRVGGNGGGGDFHLYMGQLGLNGSPGIGASGTTASLKFEINGAHVARFDPNGRFLLGTTSSLNNSGLLQTYKATGPVFNYIRSDGLSDGETAICLINAKTVGGSARQAEIGAYKHSGILNAVNYIRLEAEDGNANFYWTDNSDQFRISTSAANIGTTNGTVVGTQTSDLRLKNIEGEVSYGLAEVLQLQPKKYALKDDPGVSKLGFIAQEVEQIIPEAVYDTLDELEGHQEGDRTKLGMEYVQLVPVLVNAVKELKAENDSLRARLDAAGI